MSLSNGEIVERLASSNLYRDYARAFAGAVGISLIFAPQSEADESPWRTAGDRASACAPRRGTSDSASPLAADLPANVISGREIEPGIASAFSACESFGATVPVKLGARWIGNLGPRLPFAATPTASPAPTGVVYPARYQAMLDLLRVFAAHLVLVGNRILLEERATESPAIARVKIFIAEHLMDEIKLADAARQAHMSTCYFCKVFRRATGLAFTDYLSRLRIEQARTRLLDPHLRVSEVAFEVGFQSLSQFNRVFKRVMGRCPTEYRRSVENGVVPAATAAGRVTPRPRRLRFGAIIHDGGSERSPFAVAGR